MKKIHLGVARKDVSHFVDIMALNGFVCEIQKQEKGPTSIFVTIPDEQFIIDSGKPAEVRFLQ